MRQVLKFTYSPHSFLIDLEVYYSWTRDALGGATGVLNPPKAPEVLETDLLILRELLIQGYHPFLTLTHSLCALFSLQSHLFSQDFIKKCVRFDLF